MREEDVRTLCYSCREKYWSAGFVTKKIWTAYKEPCDMCRVRMGWLYVLTARKD